MDWQKSLAGVAALCIATFSVSPALAQPPALPDKVPAPEVHAPPAGNIPPKHLGDTPVPEPRPGRQASSNAANGAEAPAAPNADNDARPAPTTPATAPLPQQSPEPPEPQAPPDPRSAETPSQLMPPAEITCRQRLRTLGVDFEARPAEKDDTGCSVPYPISVRSLGKGVALEPEALMNCAMTEAAARFVTDVVAPAAKREFGAELKSITQASAYVCRPRNGTTKLSEHAFGNALDISRVNLSDGKAVDVILHPGEREARFLGAVRKAACGPFKTVLGPGSNADHETHLHLDLAPRHHGGTVCE